MTSSLHVPAANFDPGLKRRVTSWESDPTPVVKYIGVRDEYTARCCDETLT